MSVKIRLSRHGAKKAPYYRVVVADERMPRDGRIIEEVGRYNPCVDPSFIKLDLDKVDEWIKKGAQPSDRVATIIECARTGAEPPASTKVTKAQKKKAQAAKQKKEEAAEAAKEAAEAKEAPAAEAAEEAPAEDAEKAE